LSSLYSKIQVAPLPDTPLQRHIGNAQFTEQILCGPVLAENWLGLAANTFASTGQYNSSGCFNPYTTAPNAPHIIWTAPTAPGGQIGGEFGGSETSNFMTTSIMQPKFAPIIMNGILYYTDYPGAASTVTGWTALNLRTGQVVWTVNTTQVLKMG